MSRLTNQNRQLHAICRSCASRHFLTIPKQRLAAEKEICCQCGDVAYNGDYITTSPLKINCLGEHDHTDEP